MSITKKQHYVTKAILDFFTDENGAFYEFLVENVNKKPYKTNPDKAMCASYVYEHELLDVNTIEDLFAETVDAELPKIISKIIKDLESFEKHANDESINNIYETILGNLENFLIAYYRSGALLEEFASNDKKIKIDLMLRKILDFGYIAILADVICDSYKFAVLKSNNNFLISDQYISTAAIKVKSRFVEVSNRNMGLKETIILIPISSQYYIVFWHSSDTLFKEKAINYVDGELLEKINRTIINNSYKKCVGMKSSICEDMQEKFTYNSPSTIFSMDFSFTKKKEVFWNEQDEIYWKTFQIHQIPEEFDDLGRNDICSCKSGKKYKKCHYYYKYWWNNLVETFDGAYPFVNVMKYKERYVIDGISFIEAPIDQIIKLNKDNLK